GRDDGPGRGDGEEPAARGPGQTAGTAAMNCDDFLPALETGGYFRRAAARRHAPRCPACARTPAAWGGPKRDLAGVPPLAGRGRELWTAAARSGEARPRVRRMRRAVDFAIAASLLLLAAYLFLLSRRDRDIVNPLPLPTPEVVVTTITPESVA